MQFNTRQRQIFQKPPAADEADVARAWGGSLRSLAPLSSSAINAGLARDHRNPYQSRDLEPRYQGVAPLDQHALYYENRDQFSRSDKYAEDVKPDYYDEPVGTARVFQFNGVSLPIGLGAAVHNPTVDRVLVYGHPAASATFGALFARAYPGMASKVSYHGGKRSTVLAGWRVV